MAKQNRKCFNLHRQFMKPRMAGGLTRLLVPSENDATKWKTIINPTEMEDTLIAHCQEHFKEAHGSPYTVPPLSTMLNPDSITGTVHLQSLEVSHHTKLLLMHQKAWNQQHLPHFHNLTFDDMVAGFRKWPEWTSTSPSGRHLGIYKSLSKDANRSQRWKQKVSRTPKPPQQSQMPGHDGKMYSN